MACSLTPTTTSNENYTAPVGATVTIALKAPAGVKAELVHIRYAKEAIDDAAPFQFEVQAGGRILVVLVEAPKPGALLSLIEQCGSTQQVLDVFHYDPLSP